MAFTEESWINRENFSYSSVIFPISFDSVKQSFAEVSPVK